MSDNRNPIARLWVGFWRAITWLRIATFNLLFLLLLAIVFTTFFTTEETDVPREGPLVLVPSGYLVDQKSYRSPSRQLLDANTEKPAETVVRDLVDAVAAGALDENVNGLVLELDYLIGGALSKLEEVGQALEAFKATGKPVIAYSDNYTQAQYYLASYADEIYLNDMGAVLLNGFSMYQHYMKEGLEKLDVNVHVFRVGEYKDFIEPFTRNDMSDVSREHNSQWVNQLWGVYTSRIETARQLPAGAVDDFINNMDQYLQQVGGDSAQLALENGLVDHALSRVTISNMLIDRFGANKKGDSFKGIPHRDYLSRLRLLEPSRPDQVALIVASGNIVEGEQPTGTIGSDTLARLIRDAREDDAIKALVLRVDSGGGSAFASEIIRQELAATREMGKPVIVSMGSVAASGGYWISSAADQIWATPTTITGSIGVFGIFPTFEETLDKVGIHVDGIATTDLAGTDRIDRPLSDKAERIAQASVESIYQRFISLVAGARNKTAEEVHAVAQGRIWTGATAAELGLVDNLGYLRDAIVAAAQAAGISDDFSVELIERDLTPMEQLMRAIGGESQGLVDELRSQAVSEFTGASTGLLASHTEFARFRQRLEATLSPLMTAKHNGVYAQCLQCSGL